VTIGSAPAHLSPSQISTLTTCGRQYELERIYRAPSMPAWFFVGGTTVHRATETADLALYRDGYVMDDHEIAALVMNIFDEEIENAKDEEPDTTKWRTGGRGGAEDYLWWREKTIEFTRNWTTWRDQSGLEIAELPNGEPAIEVALNPVIGGEPFKLAIDRVMVEKVRRNGARTRQLVVIDIKCGSREPSSPFQLVNYAAALKHAFDVDAAVGYYWLARKGVLGSPHMLTGLIPAAENMARTARKIIDAGLFLPNIGPLCGSCSVRKYCDAQGGDPAPLFAQVS
jgi:hypothetical protein